MSRMYFGGIMKSSFQKVKSQGFSKNQKIKVLGIDVDVKLTSSETHGKYFAFESVVPAGQGVPPHTHQHEDEVLKIIDGEFEIFLGGRIFRAEKGNVYCFPRGVSHGFKNLGKTDAQVFFFVSPAENFERFFGELSALPANQPPDMNKVNEIFLKYGLPLDN